MINHKLISRLAIILSFGLAVNSLISCSENKSKEPVSDKEVKETTEKYDGVMVKLDISNNNSLSILLTSDGTINRKGSVVPDPKDKNFFMGLTDSKTFDSLMNEMPAGLSAFCNTPSPECDTLKQTCKAKISFGNNTTSCKIEYCVNGTINDLPKPIKDFIERSVVLTDPWYQQQVKMAKGK